MKYGHQCHPERSEGSFMAQYYVYIATNWRNTVLYTGVTSGLLTRMYQHKYKLIPGFTSKYNVNKLAFYEAFDSPSEAIAAEKKIKGWTRKKKFDLIRSVNPKFEDLSGLVDSDEIKDSSLRSE
jgi:putative endonuclease